MADAVINPSGIIDQSPVGIFQLRVFVLCALVAALDGFDTQAIGYVAPLVASAIEIPISSFSLIFSAGLLGASVGAFAFGPLADRFGRKRLLVAACILFASFTLATIGVRSFQGLLALRFLAGLGLGGATPSFLALSAEFSPKRLRSLTITALFAAFPFGGFVGGFASSYLISHYGWQTVFVAGGVTPLLIAGLLAIWLPESLHFMASRGTDKAAVVAVLNRISPTPIPESASIAFPENPPETAPPVRGLFTEGRAPRTLLLGVPFFMGFMILVTVTAWTPSLLKSAGIPLSMGALIIAANNLGSVVGTTLSGYLLDRFGAFKVLAPAFVAGAIALAAFGSSTASEPLLGLTAALAGFFVGGASSGLLALAASLYPVNMRSTGIGWGMGMGRLGQIVGPLLLGGLVSRQATIATIFFAAAVPCLIAALFIVTLRRYTRGADSGSLAERRRHSALAE
ncbi:MFS transporter [Methylocella tundrae]|nr:MFS transporter [Methylocella tundrae]